MPAVNVLIRTGPLVKYGYLEKSQAESLQEIYACNPLLFDFVLKRVINLPGTRRRLPASVFLTNATLGV